MSIPTLPFASVEELARSVSESAELMDHRLQLHPWLEWIR